MPEPGCATAWTLRLLFGFGVSLLIGGCVVLLSWLLLLRDVR